MQIPTGYHRLGIVAGFIAILQALALPLTSFALLYACLYGFRIEIIEPMDQQYLALGLVASLLSYIFSRPQPGELSGSTKSGWATAERLTLAWFAVVACLLMIGYAGKVSIFYSRRVLLTWFLITPPASVFAWVALRAWLRHALVAAGTARSVVIAGINQVSLQHAANMADHPELGLAFKGFFEDRNKERFGEIPEGTYLGKLDELPDYAQRHNIDTIFIAIPISHIQRTRDLLDALRDTTASVYFIPDIFVVDLIQSRSDDVLGIPVVALCETPFYGWRAVAKRMSDLFLASTMLILAAPVMFVVAIAVKLTSPGTVFFKQRRYGLDGEEIIVYKFRTMVTSDDGSQVKQAARDDPRVTPIGRFLRRTSLDELPQLINVLQGRMSVVGPRPHAVAHNEEYRKLIKGYMVRHKVAPGITGLAQVNGYRGETSNIEDMQQRVYYDLRYLREWSLSLDLRILTRTARSLLGDKKAY